MHNLISYICDELDEYERKAEDGRLSTSDIEIIDKLAHIKKSLLASEEMSDRSYDSGRRSYEMSNRRGRSYEGGNSNARGRYYAKRDSMGRYTRDGGYSYADDETIQELKEIMQGTDNQQMKQEIQKTIQKIEGM